jgi:hypothetical protein
MEEVMTLDELDHTLPNGFHDAKIYSLAIDYAAASVKLRMALLVGWPDDPVEERERYQDAELLVTGLSFCSIDPPSPNYPFVPDGKPIGVGGDLAREDHLPLLPHLSAKFPPGTSCYRFFVHDWNAFIYIAARDAQLSWMGTPPKHAQ